MLVDSDDIISNDADIAETFNSFFVTIAESLSIRENPKQPASTEGLSDPVFAVLNKFSNPPSIIRIKDIYQRFGSFSFRTFTRQDVETELANLTQKRQQPIKMYLLNVLKTYLTYALTIYWKYLITALKIQSFQMNSSVLMYLHCIKRARQLKRIITGQLAFYPQYQKYLRDSATSNCLHK